ncbi:MAG: hypothetical protein E7397_04270 [Ruminococcaceae bacterium]|nr:hypothetical protein [Oscillospiraceae bacterium]
MKRRFLKFGMLILFLFCFQLSAGAEGISFYNAGTGQEAEGFSGTESIYATVDLSEDSAWVVLAGYEESGRLQKLLHTKAVSGINNYTTPEVSVAGLDLVKLFLWDGSEKMVPVSDEVGVLKKIVKNDCFALVFEHTEEYIYRVGTQNPVELGSLFSALPDAVIDSATVTATVSGADYTYSADNEDWTKGTISFLEEGFVTVTVSEGNGSKLSVQLEVIDAYNVTTYAELANRNSVLLCDIKMANNASYRLTGNHTLYGNGFTFDVTNGVYTKPNYDYNSYVIYLEDSNLNNVKIVGKVYTQFGGTRNDDYNRAIVLTYGDSTIANSYISNGASPVRASGRLELINTTLKGGIYANLDLRSGQLILDNVTTINQVQNNDVAEDGTVIVGLGIVAFQEGGSDATNITIRNGLHQYNYLSKAQADEYITNSYATIVKNRIFGTGFPQYQYDDGTTKWVNTGIISMNDYISAEDVIDERPEGTHAYFGTEAVIDISKETRNCYVYTEKPTEIKTAPEYVTPGQYEILPVATFDFTGVNYIPNTGDTDRYCYAQDGTVYISLNEGEEAILWDTKILTVTKLEQPLDYQVTMGTENVTGQVLSFDKAGDYRLIYSYTDPYNYRINEAAQVETYEKTYTKMIPIRVRVKKAGAKNAVFTFGTETEQYAARVVTQDNINYVMPDVDAVVDGKIGSKKIGDLTVYYPITEMFPSDGTNEHTGSEKWYACFPIFKDAVWITDYADNGCGEAISYNQNTVKTVEAIPETLFATEPLTAFRYQMNANNYPAPTEPYMLNDIVCYTSNRNGLSASNTREEHTTVAEYSYQDNVGRTYIYYVGYHCPAQTNGNGGGCVTADTLVTMADGSRKQIMDLKPGEQLKVWDFETGAYTTSPIAVIRNHGFAENTVITLQFSDGTETKVVNEHGYFDTGLCDFAPINEKTAKSYLGHSFVKETPNGYTTVTLTDVLITKERTEAWSLLTAKQYNFITDGIFSISSSIRGLEYFTPFEIGADMKLDAEKKQADIQKYGLYLYEDFADMLTPEQFEALNMPQIRVSVGKGIISWEDLIEILRIEVLTE